MKKFIYILSSIVVTVLIGCDKIDENNRIIEVEPTAVKKRVLLEDFTGWQCVNCPEASAVAAALKEEYGENLIVVALHPDGDINTDPSDGRGPDFRTQEAKEYKEYFKPEGFPVGMIDRSSFNGRILHYKDNWIDYVQERLRQEPNIDIELGCEQSSEQINQVTITASVTAFRNIEQSLTLQLWLTENKIIAPQLTKGGRVIEQYEHNHVLRGAINGVWGEGVPDLNTQDDFTARFSYTYTIDSDFKIENCTIVGFVYDASSREILQSQEISIIN